MRSKPHIVAVIPGFLPGARYGGPVQSLVRIMTALSNRFTFSVVTSIRDLAVAEPYPDLEAGRWYQRDAYEVLYLSRKQEVCGAAWRYAVERSPDLLYLNTLFHPTFTGLPLLLRRVTGGIRPVATLIAPRGELLPGALALSKWRKRAYRATGSMLRLWKDARWHATGPAELDVLTQLYGPHRVSFAPPVSVYPAQLSNSTALPVTTGKSLRVLFVSRIAREKNLSFALSVLARTSHTVSFTIAGPVEDHDYFHACRAAIETLPANVRVELLGVQNREQLAALFHGHDVLLLPTVSENFGHVIAESIASGLPVLISDRTPFRGLAVAGAGWDLTLEELPIWVDALSRLATESPAERASRRVKTLAYARTVLNPERAAEMTAQMFQRAISGPD